MKNLDYTNTPKNHEAEQAVLGSCILDFAALGKALEKLKPDDFYDSNHKSTFETMLDMYNAGCDVDLVTLVAKLSDRGTFEKFGGQAFLASLLNAVSATDNIDYYVNIVKGKSMRRQLIEATYKITNLAHNYEMDDSEAIERAEQIILKISESNQKKDWQSISQLADEIFEQIQKDMNNNTTQNTGFYTGLGALDRRLNGLQPGELYILAARPSMGKTSLAMNLAQYGIGHSGDTVLIFSLEMSAKQLALKMFSSQSGISLYDINLKVG